MKKVNVRTLVAVAGVAVCAASFGANPEQACGGRRILGYQLDISRDKVPTMATLYRMVDVLGTAGGQTPVVWLHEVCGARARLEPNGLLWNPARKCLVGATTPIAKCMAILQERVGLTPGECRAIGHDNALSLIGLG